MSIHIERTALLPYTALQMYELVNDVQRYPEFLPWCAATSLLESSETALMASITVAKLGVKQTFSTRNEMIPGEQIRLSLVDGPFSHMTGIWTFKALNESACKISLEMDFDYKGMLIKATLGPLFTQAANTMVDAFCARAKQLYG
ncbi:type II toxin-antitoxin system RatA family toxin [Pseudomonas sp. F1_0610]|uniref:type II toxin-antitoxin system RatA family toxin n=1 Tax=Pseudomonas sp. F1_0610 TaxID=3114284 RepID=UPI0039C2A4AB